MSNKHRYEKVIGHNLCMYKFCGEIWCSEVTAPGVSGSLVYGKGHQRL